MSRPRRPQQEARCCTLRVAIGLALARFSLSRQNISGRDRVWSGPRVSMSRQSIFVSQ